MIKGVNTRLPTPAAFAFASASSSSNASGTLGDSAGSPIVDMLNAPVIPIFPLATGAGMGAGVGPGDDDAGDPDTGVSSASDDEMRCCRAAAAFFFFALRTGLDDMEVVLSYPFKLQIVVGCRRDRKECRGAQGALYRME